MGSIDPMIKSVQKVPPELIEGAMIAVRNAERKSSAMYQAIRNKEWMTPAILIGVALTLVVCYLILNGQADLVGMCKTGAAVFIPPGNVTVLNP
jgi:hypothetical protein